MKPPHDQEQRDRFVQELDRNFSVIASAGSGKTRGITDRIVALARHDRAADWLPSLVVVTYTNRAAAEMQQRARQSILAAGVSLPILAAFNRAFFGTIHSLCLKLLRQHGHHLGLPARLDHLDEEDDGDLWREFVQGSTTIAAELGERSRQALLRLVGADDLMELARRALAGDAAPPPGDFPNFDFRAVYAFTPGRQSANTCARSQGSLRRWENAWQADGFAGAPPKCECKPLQDTWRAALEPIIRWRRQAARHVATGLANAYREFRLNRGVMTFGDQVELAAALLRHPEAADRIRARQYRVILDEAQDTDPAQFAVLLEMTRPHEASGAWPEERAHPPLPGRFCMVGDFQQSIYGRRADLTRYRQIHDALIETAAGEALTFSVTFRLDEAGAAFVNTVFPSILHGQDRQVAFVELRPRPEAFPGQIVRYDPAPQAGDLEQNIFGKMTWEARRLAEWLRAAGLEKLRASSWREVAVLCPRNRWLAPIRTALRDAGLQAQLQSERAIKGDSPACAWFTALLVALAEPRDSYEIAGVLREVFGISDHDLAVYSEGYGDRFYLDAPHRRGGPVAATLDQLTALRQRMKALPLFDALEEMVRTTQLRDRLLALPADQFENLEIELEELLTQGAAAEAVDATLESFAADLRDQFHLPREVRGIAPDAIQIITGYKAKGSEWDAVVVPYFAQEVSSLKSPFPRLLRDPRRMENIAAFDENDFDDDLQAAIDLQEMQELERLLYVALTRARHTLVIVDDRKLFAGKSGLPSKSQARLLLCSPGDANAAAFEGLPEKLTPCAKTASGMADQKAGRSRERIVALPAVPPNLLDHSRERAASFLKRNPSALAEAAMTESVSAVEAGPLSRQTDLSSAGKRYGTWWHSFVEHLDWAGGPALWDKVFDEHLIHSPDTGRSRSEWQALRESLTNRSELARLLTTRGLVVHAEMPFLWAMSPRECLDGIIDLAVLNPADGHWLILDWKTNRLTEGGLAALRTHYLPQLSAYWKAASKILKAPVAAGLYSTTTGKWLPYQTVELDATWEKLQDDSPRLASAMDDDRGDWMPPHSAAPVEPYIQMNFQF